METTKSIVQMKSAFSLSEWKVQVTACQESGKTVKAWCEENGISPATYYNRRNRSTMNTLPDRKRLCYNLIELKK